MIDLTKWRSLKRHPLSAVFGDMTEEEFAELRADIKENGFDERMKIVIFEGQVLDGWHRQRACVMEHVQPTYETYKGDKPLKFVIRRNMLRRHWSVADRALAAARIANMRKGSQDSNASTDAFVSQKDAAKAMNVSRESVQRAKAVLDSGVDDIIEALKTKAISLSAAAKLAREINKAVHEAKPSKNGKPKKSKKEQLLPFPDDAKIDRAFEEVLAALEARQQAFGHKPELKAILDDVDAALARWHEFAGKPAPEQEIIPDELDTPEFRKVWDEWKAYRKEIKNRLSPTMRRRQLKELAEWGLETAIKSMETSMTKGWHGLFTPKDEKKPKENAALAALRRK